MNMHAIVRFLGAVFSAALLLPGCGLCAKDTVFRAGDRWAVVGDSITQGGRYHQYVELFYRTRFPGRELAVFNCGISGDTAYGTVRRFSWDLEPCEPTVATIMLGMNDVTRFSQAGKAAPEQKRKQEEQLVRYEESMRTLLGELRKAGTRVILLTPSPYDDSAVLPKEAVPDGNRTVEACAAIVRKLSAEYGVGLIEFQTFMVAFNRERQKADPSFTVVGPDRVHPRSAGHFLMAYLFLKQQEAEPCVFSVSLDASRSAVLESRRCAVSSLVAEGTSLTFSLLAEALPFPLDKEAQSMLPWVPFQAELNRESFRVSDLPRGSYALRVDGRLVNRYSSEALAEGVDLSMEEAEPSLKQARDVLLLLQAKWDLVAKLRTIAYIENGVWTDRSRRMSEAELLAAVREKIGKMPTGAENLAYRIEQHQRYLELKPHEAEYRANEALLLAKIRDAARPVVRRYTLTRE